MSVTESLLFLIVTIAVVMGAVGFTVRAYEEVQEPQSSKQHAQGAPVPKFETATITTEKGF